MIVVGLSHKNAPIAVRERVAIGSDELTRTLERFRAIEGVDETVLLTTCNRFEVYASGTRLTEDELVAAVTRAVAELGGREVAQHLESACGAEATKHLFRVASSLDSLVVGEPQILGQLKEAIGVAVDAKTIGSELSAAMRAALSVAKRVRSDTAIGEGQVSVPSVAVDLAKQIFDDLQERTALVVGAGEMAETAAKLLARSGAAMLVVNRSLERAEQLAALVGGRPRSWDDLEPSVVEADIVVASTASNEHVITRRMLATLRRRRRGRSLFVIDIAVPRNVDPSVNDLDNVYLYDIDDLSNVVAQSLQGRAQEAQRAEQMVAREAASFEERRSQQAMTPLIVALRERTRVVLDAELERTCKGRLKHLSDDDKKALGAMLDAAVNKLLHAPTTRLKQLATTPQSEDVADILRHLFELHDGARHEQEPDAQPGEQPDTEGDSEAVSERRPVVAR